MDGTPVDLNEKTTPADDFELQNVNYIIKVEQPGDKEGVDEAIKNVKARYLIEEVARAEKIEVTDKEVEEHAAKEAEKYGIDKNEFLSYVGGLDVVKYDLRMKKALSILTGEEMK